MSKIADVTNFSSDLVKTITVMSCIISKGFIFPLEHQSFVSTDTQSDRNHKIIFFQMKL